MAFQPLPPADIMATVKVVPNEPDAVPSKETNKEPHPTFGPHPNTTMADFDLKKEVECHPSIWETFFWIMNMRPNLFI